MPIPAYFSLFSSFVYENTADRYIFADVGIRTSELDRSTNCATTYAQYKVDYDLFQIVDELSHRALPYIYKMVTPIAYFPFNDVT